MQLQINKNKNKMKVIWRYTLKISDDQVIAMPDESEILCVQNQFGEPQLWVLVDTEKQIINRFIRTIGTGHCIEDKFNGKYIGTYQQFNGSVVFHVFDIGKSHPFGVQ